MVVWGRELRQREDRSTRKGDSEDEGHWAAGWWGREGEEEEGKVTKGGRQTRVGQGQAR